MNPALLGLFTILAGVGGCVLYFWGSNQVLDRFIFPAEGPNAGQNINKANMVRPWLFLFPAMFALGLYLAYPVFETLRLSLTDRDQGGAFVGLANYNQMMAEPKFWEALRNNLLWLVLVSGLSVGLGLIIAVLVDRVKYESAAKSLIFLPMAISFVGASVIWRFIYAFKPAGSDQIGLLNAVRQTFGLDPLG